MVSITDIAKGEIAKHTIFLNVEYCKLNKLFNIYSPIYHMQLVQHHFDDNTCILLPKTKISFFFSVSMLFGVNSITTTISSLRLYYHTKLLNSFFYIPPFFLMTIIPSGCLLAVGKCIICPFIILEEANG